MVITSGSPSDGLVLNKHFEGADEWLEIVHAAPRALFSGALLRAIRAGRADLSVSIDKPEIGGILRIRARDRTLVYRLVAQTEDDVFTGEWPD